MTVKSEGRTRRKQRIRKKVRGTAARPRLSVYRSARHIYVQLIDDEQGKTLAAASSLVEEVKKVEGPKSDVAKAVGKAIAQASISHGIKQVVFDRNGYRYHGRVKAVADGAREAGLDF